MGFCDIMRGAADISGGKFYSLPQGKLLKHLDPKDPSRKGVCRALSLIHSALLKQGTNIGKAVGKDKDVATEAREKYEAAMSKFSAKLQDDVTSVTSAATSSSDLQGALKMLYDKQAPLLGLSCSAVVKVNQNYTKAIGDFTLMSPDSHYIQVILPVHVVMVYTAGTRTALYDPNCGEARTETDARGLLGYILTHPVFMDKYGLSTVFGVANNTDVYLAFLS
jgi:hypothetical protein